MGMMCRACTASISPWAAKANDAADSGKEETEDKDETEQNVIMADVG